MSIVLLIVTVVAVVIFSVINIVMLHTRKAFGARACLWQQDACGRAAGPVAPPANRGASGVQGPCFLWM